MNKMFKVVGILTIAAVLQSVASAGYYLPQSSFWEGSRVYTKDNVNAYVEYAVYNTSSSTYHNQLDGLTDGFVNPGTGRYIYAYQIVANNGTTLPAIATFELLGGKASAAAAIGSQSDGNGGLLPTNDGTSFVWKFANGIFVADEHSAFMVFCSNYGPKGGNFKITAMGDSGEEPPVNGDGDVPEPATMAMLAMGALGLARKYKK